MRVCPRLDTTDCTLPYFINVNVPGSVHVHLAVVARKDSLASAAVLVHKVTAQTVAAVHAHALVDICAGE